MPEVEHVVSTVEHLDARPRAVPHQPVAKVRVLEPVVGEALVVPVHLLEEGAVDGDVRAEDLRTVPPPQPCAPEALAGAAAKTPLVRRRGERLVSPGVDVRLGEGLRGLFADEDHAAHLERARLVGGEVTLDEGGRRHAVPVDEDEQGLVRALAHGLVHDRRAPVPAVLVPDVVDGEPLRGRLLLEGLHDGTRLGPRAVVGHGQGERLRRLTEVAAKRPPEVVLLAVGHDDDAGVRGHGGEHTGAKAQRGSSKRPSKPRVGGIA